ncbi:hypothetical protein BDN71DRAFT_1479744 [Pleurotus eryngii]|uniref:Uncharacterized protein n=1 Tax=Pleurotus eryngii TaxID=5323 RepID=A0A9P6DJN3_PLEER|nr:hypothetical protein BDN71DRAFT_1479744 [Pleurotus eryngii]
MHEPIARSIWCDIIQDKYVNFEKLYASILPGYDHRDEAKEFVSGYAIIKKDSVNVRRPLSDEADWIRVFGAWEAAVIMVYPHRKDELVLYHRYISDLFHAIPSPLTTIRLDAEVRERYARLPFRLDDRTKMDIPLYVQIFRGSPLATAKNKRPLATNSPTSPSKRTSSVCLNWNFSNCADPCPNKRRHGICSECGDKHRARDVDECYSALRASRQRGGGGQDTSRGGPSRS